MSHIPRMFCFCGGEMKNMQTGVVVEVRLPDQDDAPYYKISCDIHECIDCESKVMLTAQGPLAHPHQTDRWANFGTDYMATIRG